MKNAETPQATPEKVRELVQLDEQAHPDSFGFPATQGEMESREDYKDKLSEAFPSIASLVESQAKRIEELEKALQEEKDMDCPECGYGISI